MKKYIFVLAVVCLLASLSACQKKTAVGVKTQLSVEPTSTLEVHVAVDPKPSNPEGPEEPTQVPVPTKSPNKPYDPSIFIIEASGSWRQELAPGYFADYEIDLYLHKIDPNDNRAVTGAYDGAFWMQTTIDAKDFITDMVGDVPVTINFDAGAEAVSDNFGISLNTTVDKAWVDYSILDENDQALPLTRDTPVDKGLFVVVAKEVYLDALGSGAQGEKVVFSTTEGSGDVLDVHYVVHVQPNSMEAADGTRKVTFYFWGEGFSHTMEGVMRRIPGYREDVEKYYDSPGYQNSTWSKLR